MTTATLGRPDRFEIGRVFNTTFGVITRNIGLCVGLALLFSGLPALVAQLWDQSRMDAMLQRDPATLTDPGMMLSNSSVGIIAGLVSYICALLLQSALVRATIEDLNSKQPSFGDCIQVAFRFLLPTLAIGLLVVLGAFAGGLLLFVPGIILWLGWSVAVPVLIQERLGVFGSMSRSRLLTKGSRWALFGLFVILFIIAAIVQSIAAVVVVFFHGVAAAVLAALVQSVVSMVMSTSAAVSYVELRQVKEGASVDELAKIFS